MLRWTLFLLTGAAAAVLTALAVLLAGHRGLDEALAFSSLGAGLAVGGGAAWHTRGLRVFNTGRVSPWAWVTLGAFALFALRAFCWLVFWQDERIEITSANNLGDLSLHVQMARFFAAGAAWWPANPEYSWGSLHYYPGMDLLQAMLQVSGAQEFPALVWAGLLGSLAAAVALYLWGGGFGVAAFLFAGGFAGWEIFQTGRFADYQSALAWKSLPLAIFVTQRGFLFALPAGLLLLAHWRRRFFPAPRSAPDWPGGSGGGRGLMPFWVEALLYAAMPAFQAFAFLFLSLLLGWWFIAYFHREELRRHLVMLVAAAALPASLLVSPMTEGFTGLGGAHLQPGWMQGSTGFLWFWWLNFGLFAPLAAGLWIYRMLPRAEPDHNGDGDGDGEDAVDAFVIPAGVIFLFACVVMLGAWDWDNTKLMLWCYLAAAPFLWEKCVAPFAARVRWPLCAVLFFSGFVCVTGALGPGNRNHLLAMRSEVDAVRFAVRDLPIDACFAAAPEYSHPLVLAGRRLTLGYEGHLISQGIDAAPLAADQRSLLLGEADWKRAARRLQARYLYWGAREERRYPGSTRAWARECPLIASGDWGKLYDLGP